MNTNDYTTTRQAPSGSPWSPKRNAASYRLLGIMVAAALACNLPAALRQPPNENESVPMPTAPSVPAASSSGACLPGTWQLVPESFDPYMRSILSEVVELNSARVAGLAVTFDAQAAKATHRWDEAVVDETKVGQAGTPDMELVLTLSGTTVSPYADHPGTAPGAGTLIYGPAEGNLTGRISINGQDIGTIPSDASDLNWTTAEEATYVCNGDLLKLTPVLPGFNVEALRFNRVSAPPPAP